jgi:hypothetical protein
MSDVHVKVVAAMKQPMEADVRGGTAEAVFEGPCHFLSETGDDGESADPVDLLIHLFICL